VHKQITCTRGFQTQRLNYLAISRIAADLVELAPPLGPTPADAAASIELGAHYLQASLEAALGEKLS
jgi:hypothetical protein